MSTKLERVEDLATEVHGRGSAVSLDRTGSEERAHSGASWVARTWDVKGFMVDETYGDTKEQALGYLYEILERKADDNDSEDEEDS